MTDERVVKEYLNPPTHPPTQKTSFLRYATSGMLAIAPSAPVLPPAPARAAIIGQDGFPLQLTLFLRCSPAHQSPTLARTCSTGADGDRLLCKVRSGTLR